MNTLCYTPKKNLFLNFKLAVVCVFSTCILVFSTVSGQEKLIRKIEVSDTDHQYLSMKNQSGFVLRFSFILNDKFYPTIHEIIGEIKKMSGNKNDSLYYYAWKFVCDNTYENSSLFKNEWITTKLLYINSVGYGNCGKEAIFLTNLWKELGYRTRMWGLSGKGEDGHIVPEVYYNNRWHMLDPTYKVYYLNDSMEIAGTEELMNHTELITNPKIILKNDCYYVLRYTDKLASTYKLKEENQLYGYEPIKEEIDSFLIELPPYSVLDLPGLFVSDFIKRINTNASDRLPAPYFANCRLKIPPSWEGVLKNVLVLAEIKGQGSVKIDGVEYVVGDEPLKNRIGNQTDFIREVGIGKHKDTIELVYYLNPIFSALQKINTLELRGQNLNFMSIQLKNLDSGEIVSERLAKEYFFYQNPRVDLIRKLNSGKQSCYTKNDVIHSAQELKTSMENYCKCYNINKKDTKKNIKKTMKAINSIPPNNNIQIFYKVVNVFPQDIIYYDFIHASAPELTSILTALTKND